MKIILDMMGSDNGVKATTEGAVMAVREFGEELILVGNETEIRKILKEQGEENNPKLRVVHADEVINMEDDANAPVRTKKNSSMAIALNMLANGEGDAVVSAGSTGAFLTGATLIVKRIRGIRRAALTPILPNAKNGSVLIDCGANVECTAENLTQFAFMGSLYAEHYMGVKSPKVALINNGAEETKGTSVYVETHAQLKEAAAKGEINFIGNIEGRDVPQGVCDVIVADGFTGNILLKTVEGVALFFMSEFKRILNENALTKVAGAIVKPGMRALKHRMDYTEVGGAPLLGISKPCIKAHGSSDARAFRSAIKQAINYASSGTIEKIAEKLGK